LCSQAGLSKTQTHGLRIKIPCALDGRQCLPPTAAAPFCDGSSNFAVASDTFDTQADIDSWIFGTTGSSAALGTYLYADQGTSKSYDVPPTASNLTVSVEVYELNCGTDSNITFSFGDQWVFLPPLNCLQHDGFSFDSNGVHVEIRSESDTADKVVFTLPPSVYSDTGRLPIGIQSTVIGIGSLSITADCSDSVPLWKEPAVVDIIDMINNATAM
jgi:hypothetical protein